MKLTMIMAAIALLIAGGWGLYAGSVPAPARAHDLTVPVTPGWHDLVPREPTAATEAYHARIPAEMRARGEAVAQTRYWVLAARVLVTVIAFAIFLFSDAAASLAGAIARLTGVRLFHLLLFAATMLAILFVMLLPVEVYAGFVRPRRFGFADEPFLDWLQDEILSWASLAVFYAIGIAAFMMFIRWRPRSWPLWAGLVYLVLASIYVIAQPVLIEPLTNTYTPIADSPLKRDILAMAHANNVRATDVFTLNASRQSRLLNAHVSGFLGTARVSLDDNLLSGQYQPGVLAVVGHEIGHYVMGHIINGVVFSTLVATVGFLVIAWMGPLLIRRFGKVWKIGSLGDTAAIAVVWALFLVYGFVSAPVQNAYTRQQEAQADLYGLNASQAPSGLAEFMIHDADTARWNPSALDILLFYDHPDDRSRVETAMRWRAAHLAVGSPVR